MWRTVWRNVAHEPESGPGIGHPARSNSIFYTEFDGRRPKRLIIKVLGE
jgi:hypothetical protein